jgi:hypothetical protein
MCLGCCKRFCHFTSSLSLDDNIDSSGNRVIVSYKRSGSSGGIQLDPTEHETLRLKIRNKSKIKKNRMIF